MSPGYRTTEFWIALLALVAAVVGMLLGYDAAPLFALVAALYPVSRGMAKRPAALLPPILPEPPPPPPPLADEKIRATILEVERENLDKARVLLASEDGDKA